MNDASTEIDRSAYRLMLDHAKSAHGEATEHWRDLDKKAQGIIALSSGFVGVSLFLLRTSEQLTRVQLWLLLIAIVVFGVAVLLSILGLSVQPAERLQSADKVRDRSRVVTEKISAPRALADLQAFVDFLVEDWHRVTASLYAAASIRAVWIKWAARVVFVAVALAFAGTGAGALSALLGK